MFGPSFGLHPSQKFPHVANVPIPFPVTRCPYTSPWAAPPRSFVGNPNCCPKNDYIRTWYSKSSRNCCSYDGLHTSNNHSSCFASHSCPKLPKETTIKAGNSQDMVNSIALCRIGVPLQIHMLVFRVVLQIFTNPSAKIWDIHHI